MFIFIHFGGNRITHRFKLMFELILVSELEKTPSLARGFRKGHIPNTFKKDWNEILAKVNASGLSIRGTDGWQKVSVLMQILQISYFTIIFLI